MKILHIFPLLCLVICAACGQVPKHRPVSRADSLLIEHDRIQSERYQTSSPDSAVWYAHQGLKLARQLKYLRGEGLLLDRMAGINAQYGNLKLALRYQQEALTYFKTLADAGLTNKAISELGILKARQGERAAGRQLVLQALHAYEQKRNIPGIILSDTRLGEIQELAGDRHGALKYYEQAETLQDDHPVTDAYFDLLNTMGKVHAQLGNYAAAAGYFEKGISKSEHSGHIKAHIKMLNKAGSAWDSLGNKAKALAYHRAGLEKARTNHLPEEEARSLIGIAGAIKTADAAQSIVHLKNALTIARQIGHQQLAAEIYESLSDIYRQQSRYQDAMETLSAHHRVLDSILQASENHRIAVLQGSYDLAESRLHIERLELVNERHIYQRGELLIAVIAVLIITGIITFYYLRTRKLNQRLNASNQIKDKLFSIIGHDLRNPIGGITQLLAVMEEGGLSEEEAHELISEMRKQGNVTLEILNALLNWGEAQLKGVHVKAADFNATDSVRKNILALQRQAADKSVIVTDHVSPKIWLHGDQHHFEFIVRNLLSNAIKFSRPGEDVEIATELQLEADMVIFSVKDYGKGISPEQQSKFLKSEMEITYGTKGEKGTGIGLMLSKEFISANRGRIWIESEPSKGTTFYFTFKLARSE